VECIASGLVSALSVFADIEGRALPGFPGVTMVGSLMNYVHTATRHFQPMNANMGLLPPVPRSRGGRRKRYLEFSRRAEEAMQRYRDDHEWLFRAPGAQPGDVLPPQGDSSGDFC
jgi:methylenetetrahydrofolate--tRNA-(uracil-5-)-methyltransferase